MPAIAPTSIRLGELIASLSLATDLGNGCPLETALRRAHLAVGIGRRMGLPEAQLSDAFYVALLGHVGCTAIDYEMGSGYGDTAAMRRVFESVFFSPPSAQMPYILGNLGAGEPMLERARLVAVTMTKGMREGPHYAAVDCEVMVRFARRLGASPGVASALSRLWQRWDAGHSQGSAAGVQTVAALGAFATAVEIERSRLGRDAAAELARRERGRWFDPAAVDAFLAARDELLEPIEATSVWEDALDAEPQPRVTLQPWQLDDVTAAFADFVDLKSPYLLGHSSGVGRLASAAGSVMGLPKDQATALLHAGRLHDLGRVSVPNSIWDKPGRLSAGAWERVRLHPYYTERVVAGSSLLAPFVRIAGLHHERGDGSGYHRGLRDAMLPLPARIVAAADAYHAMTEQRAHRPALSAPDAAREIAASVERGLLDRDAANAVCEAAGHRMEAPPSRPAGLTEREVEVLRYLARGRSKKEIASHLGIAPGTVHTHVVHLYEKIGISSRAVAALFAMEHGLIEPEMYRTMD